MYAPASPRPWIVFSDDWGRHPSSCQHLVGQLLAQQPVAWVNTIGTRPPRLDWGTAKRVAQKLRGWVLPAPGRPAGATDTTLSPAVISPKMFPSFEGGFARTLNKKLLLRALRPVITAMPEPPNIITTLPLVADLVGELPANRWVYYCVDDFSVWPGYDGETMLRLERDLVPKVQAVVVVSETLRAHIAQLGRSSELLTHGVDLAHWHRPAAPLAEFAGLPRPLAVFWGVIDRRMDLAFVRALGAKLPGGTILLVGPKEDPEPELLHLPRVQVRPPMRFADLPALAAAADVLVMPYADIPATRAMQPLKLKEYLATGKPTVVRALPSTLPWSAAADVCATPDDFADAVLLRSRTGLPAGQRLAREILAGESWSAKAAQFASWVNG